MDRYWVNNSNFSNPNNNYEVHKEGCRYMPSDKTYLGYHSACDDAVEEAKKYYDDVDGCKTCSEDCHFG